MSYEYKKIAIKPDDNLIELLNENSEKGWDVDDYLKDSIGNTIGVILKRVNADNRQILKG